jgi:hypothetical protein
MSLLIPMSHADLCAVARDRELLELAAKAAGYSPCRVTNDGVILLRGIRVKWKPLDDDGDALRLAVAIPGLDLKWIIAAAWQAHDSQPERNAYVRRKIVEIAADTTRAT